jgi:hypothetical protein
MPAARLARRSRGASSGGSGAAVAWAEPPTRTRRGTGGGGGGGGGGTRVPRPDAPRGIATNEDAAGRREARDARTARRERTPARSATSRAASDPRAAQTPTAGGRRRRSAWCVVCVFACSCFFLFRTTAPRERGVFCFCLCFVLFVNRRRAGTTHQPPTTRTI